MPSYDLLLGIKIPVSIPIVFNKIKESGNINKNINRDIMQRAISSRILLKYFVKSISVTTNIIAKVINK